jgi:hypothetical protein
LYRQNSRGIPRECCEHSRYRRIHAAFRSENFEQGTAYFQAASHVYAAAWKKQSTDPNVGTEYATSLFFSGDIDGAVRQGAVRTRLPESPNRDS